MSWWISLNRRHISSVASLDFESTPRMTSSNRAPSSVANRSASVSASSFRMHTAPRIIERHPLRSRGIPSGRSASSTSPHAGRCARGKPALGTRIAGTRHSRWSRGSSCHPPHVRRYLVVIQCGNVLLANPSLQLRLALAVEEAVTWKIVDAPLEKLRSWNRREDRHRGLVRPATQYQGLGSLDVLARLRRQIGDQEPLDFEACGPGDGGTTSDVIRPLGFLHGAH